MIKRKSHEKGVAHSRNSGGVPAQQQRVTTHHRNRSKSSTAETLLTISLILVFVFISGVYIYHFTAEPPSDAVPLAPQASVKVAKESPPLRVAIKEETPFESDPLLPPLPPFATIPNAERLMEDAYHGKPTIAGITSILQKFLSELHKQNFELVDTSASIEKVISSLFELIEEHLLPIEGTYRGKPMFPIREDGSIYMSLAAFREHLLMETLAGAFSNAKNPDKLFVGVVVQNCFGKVDADGTIHADGLPCRTGAQVIGKNAKGRDMTKVSDAPPDVNGIELFCTHPDYKKYCDAGQIRVLYVHETESLGPAMARYFASILWGGETYFMQSDSHLKFAEHWDEKYIMEAKATMNYPKSVLSSYPPGFSGGDKSSVVKETNGARLCSCGFSTNTIERNIVRIGTGQAYSGSPKRPTQIPFIAAGFFFARAEFLVDVPFDPFMPWCFMGEEIALSMRAWTSGWNIYAPRKNLISHQYRPGRMGLPKFWGTVNRLFARGAMNNNLQAIVIQRVKNLVGYAESSEEIIKKDGYEIVLKEKDHYWLGSERTYEEYLSFAGIDMKEMKCNRLKWCNEGSLD